MISKRLLAAVALDGLGALGVAVAARRRGLWPWRGLSVLLYHRIAEPADVGDLDRDMIDATPDEFEAHMRLLRRDFQPVTLSQVLAANDHTGAPLPPGAVLVTFDDGYRDNCDNALPILQRHGVSAVFFVSTQHLTERRLFWWERVALLVRQSARPSVEIEYPQRQRFEIATPEAKNGAIDALNAVIKKESIDLELFLKELAVACGVTWTETEDRRRADEALMSWDQVAALRDAGMSVESHTRSHRVLQTLSASDLAAELGESREEIERRLGRPVRTIAYPVGKPIATVPAIRDAIVAAGYQLGFTTVSGVNDIGDDDPFDLKRTIISMNSPPALVRLRLAMPSLVG